MTPKAFALLELLVRQRPRAVSKAELRDVLWPDCVVTDGNLANLALEVRQAIGDDARRPRYLRTVRGFGYAFERDPETGKQAPVLLRLVSREREFALGPGSYDIGRGRDVAIAVAATNVSRRHARIRIDASGAIIEDLGSKNGTYLCGAQVTAPEPLEDGDVIRLGGAKLVVRFTSSDGTTETLEGGQKDTPEP
jgi:hypothetical protein